MKVPTFRPKCPECGSILEGVPFPLPAKGIGRCPAAGNYEFEAEVQPGKFSKDKNGNLEKVVGWKTSGGGAHSS